MVCEMSEKLDIEISRAGTMRAVVSNVPTEIQLGYIEQFSYIILTALGTNND